MTDIFHSRLVKTSQKFKNVHVIDLRDTLKNGMWADEIHANEKGANKLWEKFETQVLQYIDKD